MAARALVAVANSAAGATEREAVEAACAVLGDHCELIETADADELDAVLVSLDGRELVVIGGDGSVHVAVARLRAADLLERTTICIVPLGTGNDLARTLGIPLEPAEASQLALDAPTRRLDLLTAEDGTVAVNAVHAGVGAVAAERSTEMKEELGQLAYPVGAVSAGVEVDGWDVEVTVDGEVLAPAAGGATLLVGVANGRTIGGGTPLAPDARPDDGLADVVVAHPVGPGARAAFGLALLRGAHVERDDVVVGQGRDVRLTGQPIPYNIDGELTGEAPQRTFRIEPAAWTVRVPAT